MTAYHPAQASPLGKVNQYVDQYQPDLLFPISRGVKWQELGLTVDTLPYHGVDIWNSYELSWLMPSGKPRVMIAEFIIPADSPFIIESKSFKLYLNSFNQSVFSSDLAVQQTLVKDLSKVAGKEISVQLSNLEHIVEKAQHNPKGICIDEQDVIITQYDQPDAQLLLITDQQIQETLYSQLLKSNCPVTGQPDWGTLVIDYKADKRLDHASLLKYVISFRQHADFHEQCVERIFLDLNTLLKPTVLTVYARYVRRGGLDINPYRSLTTTYYLNERLARQ